MRKISFLVFLLTGLLGNLAANAQVQEAPEWKTSINKTTFEPGEEIILTFEAQIPAGWYMYSSDFDPDLGPLVTEFNFEKNDTYELVGEIKPIGQKEKYDEIWDGEYTYFTKTARFQQVVKVLKLKIDIQGSVFYQICSDVNGQCIPFDTNFSFGTAKTATASGNAGTNILGKIAVSGSQRTADPMAKSGEIPVVDLKPFKNSFKQEVETEENKWMGLLIFFLLSFGGGLAALLTPCVFPMIPMTVSYFTKSGGSGSKGKLNAFLYGIFIIAIYTFVGTVFSVFFGAGFANFLSTHWLPNLLFFGIFVLFALSFFGLFEIELPNKFVNKMDQKADKGGLVGIFFMAFTLVLVSFSCTGPIAGTILLQAANGEAIMPLIGMLGFSSAFAIPFTLFAVFPGWMNSLPKSGGWLNTVKVVLGFLELALALKFLSIVDQVYHWELLDREIYLALWIVIFSLLGFYLLGKIVFPHEKKSESVSIPRLMSAVLVFSFVVYLVPGLFGAPLKALSGYLPPMTSQDFKLGRPGIVSDASGVASSCETPKYDEFLELPYSIQGFFDYEQALACAK
ncbi:MAG TPA: cytochrome c biogenesis protein CcdA, partial [Salinimicrobium sp.]|nr:cytochrome c biogenesis protein CcdA [Salinimicrobium sp.]